MMDRPRDSLCRRRQEEKAQRDRKWKKEMQLLEAILELKVANEMAEFAGEFFDLVEPRNSLPSGTTIPFDVGIADLFEGDIAAAETSAAHLEPDDLEWFLQDSH